MFIKLFYVCILVWSEQRRYKNETWNLRKTMTLFHSSVLLTCLSNCNLKPRQSQTAKISNRDNLKPRQLKPRQSQTATISNRDNLKPQQSQTATISNSDTGSRSSTTPDVLLHRMPYREMVCILTTARCFVCTWLVQHCYSTFIIVWFHSPIKNTKKVSFFSETLTWKNARSCIRHDMPMIYYWRAI